MSSTTCKDGSAVRVLYGDSPKDSGKNYDFAQMYIFGQTYYWVDGLIRARKSIRHRIEDMSFGSLGLTRGTVRLQSSKE